MTFAIPIPHPHAFIFQANLSGPPSQSFQSFQWSLLLGSQLRLIPPFVLSKIKWSPLNPPPPPPSPRWYITGDWSLKVSHPYHPFLMGLSLGCPYGQLKLCVRNPTVLWSPLDRSDSERCILDMRAIYSNEYISLWGIILKLFLLSIILRLKM